MTEKVLVTAAYKGELDRLDELPEGWIAQPCGIGGVAAAAGLSMLVTVHQPARIIVLGTCGAIGRGLSIGSLVTPALVRWSDPNILAGNAHLPPSLYRPLQLSPWPGMTVACCLQTPSVTLAAEQATLLGAQGEPGMPTVEHLELYSMAFVAHSFGIPLTAILGVTNAVGPTGHRDWKANHADVEYKVQRALFRQERVKRQSTQIAADRAKIDFVGGDPAIEASTPVDEPAPEPSAAAPDAPAARGQGATARLKRWLAGPSGEN